MTPKPPALHPPRTQPYELELSFLTMFILSGVYIAYEILTEPRGGHPFGHWLGILGTFLMLLTETLYSIRKRTNWLNWAGPVRYWLSLHIFTGLLGPFLVLMHTGLQFRGFAGITFILTAIVVSSGFIGRYLYTALPRRLSGVAHNQREMQEMATVLYDSLENFRRQKPDQVQALIAQQSQRVTHRSPILSLLGRSYYQWRYEVRLNRALKALDELEAVQKRELARLLARQRELARQMETLDAARQLLRWWHLAHVPLGLTLFFSIAVHIVATIYFRAGIFQP